MRCWPGRGTSFFIIYSLFSLEQTGKILFQRFKGFWLLFILSSKVSTRLSNIAQIPTNIYNGLPKAREPSRETHLYLQMGQPCFTPRDLIQEADSFAAHEWRARTKGLTTCLVLSLIWKFSHLSTWLWDSEQRRPCYIPWSVWYIVDAQEIFINLAFNVFVMFFKKMSPDVLNLWMTYYRDLRFSYGNCFPMEDTCGLLMKIKVSVLGYFTLSIEMPNCRPLTHHIGL